MASSLDRPAILQQFDDLVSSGILLYGPTTTIKDIDQGYPFRFRVCPIFSTKPQNPGDKYMLHSSASQSPGSSDLPAEPPKFGPGSDIFCADPRIAISTVNGTHLLVYNKFCVLRPQYMLLTADSFKRQWEDLDETDIKSTWDVINASSIPHFAIFNGGVDAGCSREHKHLQIFPRPGSTAGGEEDPLSLFLGDDCVANGFQSKVPFKYFAKRIDATVIDAVVGIYTSYIEMMKECRRALGLNQQLEHGCPHNVILAKEGIIVIPRRKARVGAISANAMGMLGLVWVATNEQVDQWKEYGPAKVLAELGVPRT